MFVIFKILYISSVFFITVVSTQVSPENSSTLELVAILHRHGFRTPTETYPTDPYQEDAWPVAFGQLLNKGKQQLYSLGETLRKRYVSHLTKYSSKTVNVRTSDLDRCQMSVACLLAAWFPPQDNEEVWNKNISWQPIPIHSVPQFEDNVLALNKSCTRYKLELQKVYNEIKENETLEDKQFFQYLNDHMGKIVDLQLTETYYGTLSIEESYGFTLPEWTRKVYPEEMKKKARLNFSCFVHNKLLKRLRGGPFVSEVLEQFVNRSKGNNKDLKLLLYSAHDTTLSAVWSALGFDSVLLPDFGSAIVFELHKYNDQYIIKMFYYKNTYETEPEQLQIPNCPSPCLLNVLFNVTEDVRPVDWDKECAIEIEDRIL